MTLVVNSTLAGVTGRVKFLSSKTLTPDGEPQFYGTGTTSFCQVLNSSYTLKEDVASTSTCFVINANDIALDCNGFTIDYAITKQGIGVDINGKKNVNITNCVMKANNVNTTANYGVRITASNNTLIKNNHIFVNGSSAANGIYITT